MMNRLVAVFTAAVLVMAFASCRKEAKTTAQAPEPAQTAPAAPVKDDGGPKDEKAIEAYTAAIDANLGAMERRGPRTVDFSSGQRGEATVYADSAATPLLLYCQIRETEQWYYLHNRRIVQFRERRPGKKGFEERRWYYSQTAVLSGASRNANTPDGLAASAPQALKPSEISDSETLDGVGMRVFEILYGRISQ